MKNYKLDEIDHQLIKLLQENARHSFVFLAEKTGLSRVAVRKRMNNLVEEGIIEKFTAVVNSERYGKKVSAFFQIEVEPSHLDEVATKLSQNENVASIHLMTGPSSLHTHVLVDDNYALRRFMIEELYELPGVIEAESQILLKRYKSRTTTL